MKGIRKMENKIRFGVLSDLHMMHSGGGMGELVNYLTMCANMQPKLDAHVFAGDIIYQLHGWDGKPCDELFPEIYDYLKLSYDRYAKDIPLVYALGNHEYPQGCTKAEVLEEAPKLYEEKMACTRCSHTVINGYHFVVIPVCSTMKYDKQDEEWAMKEMRKALRQSSPLPVFFVSHVPMQHTAAASQDISCSEEFRSFVLSHRRIIHICGHEHWPALHPKTLYQRTGGATVVHSPMSGVGLIEAEKGVPYSNQPHGAGSWAAHIYEVEGSVVKIHTYFLDDMQCHGEPWVIDVGGAQYYTEGRARKAKRPAFAPGAKATAEVVEGGVRVCCPLASCEPLPHNNDAVVPHYELSFFRKGEKQPFYTITRCGGYYLCRAPKSFDRVINLPLEKGEYRVTIKPVSFFDKVGTPISAHFRVK